MAFGEDRLTGLARKLRTETTEAEALLWSRLRNRALGPKFRRQVPLDGYILDFYAHEANLVIELDGAQHLEPEAASADAARTRHLASCGLTVLRFLDNTVLQSPDLVVQHILDVLGDTRGA